MLDDSRVLESYVRFVNKHMREELIQLTLRESELLRKANILNRKKNYQIIMQGYKEYLERVSTAWKSIYSNGAHYAETVKEETLLGTGGTIYAKSENQKAIEQFYYWFSMALKVQILSYEDNYSGKVSHTEFINDFTFGYVRIAMKRLFLVVLEAKKAHKLMIDEKDMESFVEINKYYLKDDSIPYRHGEVLTDNRINQLLNDIREADRKKQEKIDEGIRNGTIRVDFALDELEKTVKKAPSVSNSSTIEPKKKSWRAADGTIKCPGDSCPDECSLNCPIFAQTKALEKLANNDFSEAVKLLKKAVEIEPDFADAWNNLASCYGQMGNHQEAYNAFAKSYALLQKPNPLYGMAVAKKNLKDYPLAIQFAKNYQNKFGSDDRIISLLAELSENQLSDRVSKSSPSSTVQKIPEVKNTGDCQRKMGNTLNGHGGSILWGKNGTQTIRTISPVMNFA